MRLRENKLFEGLFDDDSATVIRYSYNKTYRKNAIILSQGDTSDSLYVVLSGRLRMYLDDEHGREMTLGMLEEGDFFGEIASLGGGQRPANVAAVEDCRLAIIPRHNLERCIVKYPEVASRLINQLIQRMQSLIEEIGTLAFKDVNARVARLLIRSARNDGLRLITPPMTQQDIAHSVGSSREMVSRSLKLLREGGYIETEGKSFILLRDLTIV